MKLAILISVIVAASALPSSEQVSSVSRGRAFERTLHRRKSGSKSHSRSGSGSRCGSRRGGSKSKSRSRGHSCHGDGDHHHDDPIIIIERPQLPQLPQRPQPEEPYNETPISGNKPADQSIPYVESGNLPTDETAPAGGDYVVSGNLGSGETYVPRLPAVCISGETLTIVIKGDTLDAISRANDYDVEILIAANPQFDDPNLIYPGDQVCISAESKTGYKGPVVSTPMLNEDPVEVQEPVDLDAALNEDTIEDPALQQSSAFKFGVSIIAAVAFIFVL
jgi:hypothetical protein